MHNSSKTHKQSEKIMNFFSQTNFSLELIIICIDYEGIKSRLLTIDQMK